MLRNAFCAFARIRQLLCLQNRLAERDRDTAVVYDVYFASVSAREGPRRFD